MFKLLASTFCLVSFFVSTMAQHAPTIGIGPELGLPSGNFANVSGIGLGASLKIDVLVSANFALTLNGGFMNFFGKHNALQHVKDFAYVPVKAGLKYQLSESFYAEGQIGAGFPLNDGQKTLAVWSPGFGNVFKISGRNRLDLGIRYEGWTGKNDQLVVLSKSSNTKGFLGIRFAYLFNLQ